MTSLKRFLFGGIIFAASIISLLLAVILAQSVSAGGAVGGGGSGSGGGGGAWTSYGYGWHQFSTSGSGPGYFRDGTSWSYVRNACSSTGNDVVVAFIVQTPSRSPSTAGVYKYESPDYGTYYQYLGNSGGNWLSYPAAKARYDSIDGSLKVGFSWGNNVAWFCWSNNPRWTIGVSTSVNRTTARPGDTVTWTHTIRNDGPASTNKTITYSKKVGSTIDDNRTLPSGTASGTTRSFTSSMTVTQDDVGSSFCRATSAIPSTHTSNNRINSADACVNVPYNWTSEVDAEVTRVVKSNGETSSSLAVAEPGGVVTWEHTASIAGPTKTNHEVNYSRVNGTGLPSEILQLGTFLIGTLPGASDVHSSTTTISQDQVDGNVCRLTRASPANQTGGSTVSNSAPACVSVPYNYTLDPVISTASSRAVEEGSSLTIDVSVENSGPTKSRSTEWVITMMEVAPGEGSVVPNSEGGNSATDPCGTYFTNASTTCEVAASGTSVFGTNGLVLSGDAFNSITEIVEDLPIGTQLCFSLSLSPRSDSSNEWIHAAPVCVIVGKKPKVQIVGGDIIAGRGQQDVANIITGTSIKTVLGEEIVFGSWTEYGVLSNGLISGMASGAAYNGGTASDDECTTHLLTFTSAGSSLCTTNTVKGGYYSQGNSPDVGSAFPTNNSTEEFSSLSDSNGGNVVQALGDITISGGTIEKGDWLVINAPESRVTIEGDIEYTDETLESVDDIPQLVIIANQIDIRGDVTRVDAWLVASGEDGVINTCSDVALTAPLSVDICSNTLTVNGPVIAKELYLRRTAGAGSGNASGDPAEVFNFRPDAYLWLMARSIEAGRIQSVYSTQLPPRF